MRHSSTARVFLPLPFTLCLACSSSVLMPLRRNPPSPVNKGKRNSAAASLFVREKHSKWSDATSCTGVVSCLSHLPSSIINFFFIQRVLICLHLIPLTPLDQVRTENNPFSSSCCSLALIFILPYHCLLYYLPLMFSQSYILVLTSEIWTHYYGTTVPSMNHTHALVYWPTL